MTGLDRVGAAAHRKLRAQRELQEAQAALDEALAFLVVEGIRKCHVGEVVRLSLILHGFEPQQIARLGLSDGNVRVILDRS